MARNKKFLNVYTITVEGITTNGFMAELIDNMLTAFIKSIDSIHKQTEVKIDKRFIVGEYQGQKFGLQKPIDEAEEMDAKTPKS